MFVARKGINQLRILYFAMAMSLLISTECNVEAQDLDRKQQGALRLLDKKSDQIEKTIAKIEAGDQIDNPDMLSVLQRQFDAIEKKLTVASATLKKLPAANESVVATKTRLSDLSKRADALVGRAKKVGGDSEELDTQFAELRQSEEYKQDTDLLKGICQIEAYLYRLDLPSHRFQHSAEFDFALQVLGDWETIKSQVSGVRGRYAKYGRRVPLHDLESAERTIGAVEEQIELSIAAGEETLARMDAALKAQVEKLLELKKQADRLKQNSYIDHQLMTPTEAAPTMFRQSKRATQLLKTMNPKSAKQYDSLFKRTADYYSQVVDDVTDEIMANKKMPANDYLGKDRNALDIALKQRFGDELIVSCFEGKWSRSSRYVWDPANKAMVFEDKSSLNGHALLKLDSEFALIRWVELQKDHLNNDRLRVYGDFKQYSNPRPGLKLLLKRIVK